MEIRQYRVEATFAGERVVFTVPASNGAQAVKEARQQAKNRGMRRIMVNRVQLIEKATFTYEADHEPPLLSLGGTATSLERAHTSSAGESHAAQATLSTDDVRRIIRHVWERMRLFVSEPQEPPLRVYELGGKIYLDDGANGRSELVSPTQIELAMFLYDWATYTGYCSEDFDDFIQQCWS